LITSLIGCKTPKTCEETKFGCCPDGVTPAKGKSKKCKTVECAKTLYGCCPDKKNARTGNTDDGCQKVEDVEDLTTSEGTTLGRLICLWYQVCNKYVLSIASSPEKEDVSCSASKYKCCDDGKTAAHGPNKEGCCLNSVSKS